MLKSILYTIFIFPVILLVKLFFGLLGLIMVPIGLIKAKVTEPPPHDSRWTDQPWQYVELTPKWIHDIWGSDKYGAQGNWFWNDDQDTTKFWPRFNWLALRNPTSNLERKFPWMYSDNIPGNEIEYVGNKDINEFIPVFGVYYSWYGKYGQLRAVFPIFGTPWHLRVGYKMSFNKEEQNARPTLMFHKA